MNERIKLLFSGDFVPLNQSGAAKEIFDSKLLELINSFDMHITNLECPLTNARTEIKKSGPLLKSTPDSVHQLTAAKVNTVCLANNHIFDYGEKGLVDTIDICEKNSIETLGIVNRFDSKPSYLIREFNGKRICLLNYCESEFSVRGKKKIGANGFDPIKCFYEINKTRKEADYLIVIYHGGNEFYPLPNPYIKKLFHFFVDIGADAVISHHSHVISGIEIYKNKPIAYGLGNFLFKDDEDSPIDWYYGLAVGIYLGSEIEIDFFPIQQSLNKINVLLLEGTQRQLVLERIQSLSQKISNDEILEKEWNYFVLKLKDNILKSALGLNKIERFFYRFPFVKNHMISEKKLLAAYNLIRCESLNTLLKDSLAEKLNSGSL